MIIVGIDPGKYGCIFVWATSTGQCEKYVMPIKVIPNTKRKVKAKTSKVFDRKGTMELLESVIPDSSLIFLEDPGVMGSTGKTTMVNMFRAIECVNTSLVCLGYEYELVPPKKWQKVIWEEDDIVMVPSKTGKTMVKDTKATSLNAFKRLFPDLEPPLFGDNEKKNNARKKIHDGIVDAALIAYYGLLKTKNSNG